LPDSAWRGASVALQAAGWFFALATPLELAIEHVAWGRTLGLSAAVAIPVVAALLALLLIRIVRRGPLRFWWGLLLALAGFSIAYGLIISPKGLIALLAWLAVAATAFGAGLATWREHGYSRTRAAVTLIGGAGLLALAIGLIVPGWPTSQSASRTAQKVDPLDLPDPGARGGFAVHTLTYGSGADRHRDEYGAHATLTANPVDGEHLIDGWSGLDGWVRTKYWGFDAKALPRQGRVWYPDGDGPFPLVLMVHGNHDMEDYSDGGYAYLGELFASRGIIAVSVDENFLNTGYADLLGGFPGGLKKENDARGWLLLEHLRLWREWNADPKNPFHGKVDLDRIALIGHSRGGEAVAIAAAFNRLPYFPDDSRVSFDYGFHIRGIIAIAPSDAQYQPRGRPTDISDVSYLVIQGSDDGDVESFMGSAQYSRVSFDECTECFKAGFYFVGANHGQFNTAWGRNDLGPGWGAMLNLVPIIDPTVQRRVACALFDAFLDVVLQRRTEYEPFLRNPARGLQWLGSDVAFVNQFAAADEVTLANYEEDDDLTTGTLPNVTVSATNLARWYEALVPLKWDDIDSEAALLAWNRTDERPAPDYRIDIDDADVPDGALSFALAMADVSPLDDDADWTPPDSIDFHVVVADSKGHSAQVALSDIQPLYAPIKATTRKARWLDPVDPSEPVFQRYTIPLDRFTGVDATDVTSITLRFDVTPAGSLYLDDVAMGPK
jgi:hypothetical protein